MYLFISSVNINWGPGTDPGAGDAALNKVTSSLRSLHSSAVVQCEPHYALCETKK